MRQRFTNLFKSDDHDLFAESALRRFWSLVNPPPPALSQTGLGAVPPPTKRFEVREARVIDLARWVRGRAGTERR
jgi:hypothetical protein